VATVGYTEANKVAVRAALLDVAMGAKVVSVSIGGRTVTYTPADVETLKALLAEIEEDIAKQAGTRVTRSRRVVTRRGL